MEERQRQIREGAGLEESRLNVEFIEFLKKFSTPLLMAVVVISGGYFAWNRYKIREERLTDDAFAQLDAAVEAKNPVTLLRVADEVNRGPIPLLARLTAADLHLDASRTGVPIGVTLEAKGELPKDTAPLTDEQRADELRKAADLYQQVLDGASNRGGHLELALVALHGLAACAESRGDLDAARGFYDRVIERAKATNRAEWATRAEKLKATLDELSVAPRLYKTAELPAAAQAAQPFTSDMQNIQFKSSTGKTMRMGPDGTLIEVEDPNAAAPEMPSSPVETSPGSTPTSPPAPAPPEGGSGEAPATTPPAPVPSPAPAPAAPATNPPAEPAPATPPGAAPATPPSAGDPSPPKPN